MNDNRSNLLVKWLRVLMYIVVVSLVNSVINFLPVVPASVTIWISRGIVVAMVVCMFQLAPVNERYKKAGVFRAVMLGCTLITAFRFASSILTLAASILSIIAVYQEYSAHSELVSNKDSTLSRKWNGLFLWGIIAGVLVSFGSIVTVLITSLTGLNPVRITGIIVGVLSVPQLIIDVVYLLYLKKMIGYFQNEGEVSSDDV